MNNKLQAPSRFIQRDIGLNGQTAKAVYVFERGPHKVRITVCSDSVEAQCFARAEVFTSALQWSVVSYLQRSQMSTPVSLAYRSPAPGFDAFERDYLALLGQVDQILGITKTDLASEIFALVFLDADVDDSIDDAVVGPTFFEDARSALLKVGSYVARVAAGDEALGERIRNAFGSWASEPAVMDEAWFNHWFQQLNSEQLESVLDAFIGHRGREGRICFYRVERAN